MPPPRALAGLPSWLEGRDPADWGDRPVIAGPNGGSSATPIDLSGIAYTEAQLVASCAGCVLTHRASRVSATIPCPDLRLGFGSGCRAGDSGGGGLARPATQDDRGSARDQQQ